MSLRAQRKLISSLNKLIIFFKLRRMKSPLNSIKSLISEELDYLSIDIFYKHLVKGNF